MEIEYGKLGSMISRIKGVSIIRGKKNVLPATQMCMEKLAEKSGREN